MSEYGPVETSARAMVAKLEYAPSTPEGTLAELAISLASLVDASTKKGSAMAGAQAGLQLRQTLERIIEIVKERETKTDDFAELMHQMMESMEGS